MNFQPVSLRDGRKSQAFAENLLLASVERLVQKLNEALPDGTATRPYPAFSGYEGCLFKGTSLVLCNMPQRSVLNKMSKRRASLGQITCSAINVQ